MAPSAHNTRYPMLQPPALSSCLFRVSNGYSRLCSLTPLSCAPVLLSLFPPTMGYLIILPACQECPGYVPTSPVRSLLCFPSAACISCWYFHCLGFSPYTHDNRFLIPRTAGCWCALLFVCPSHWEGVRDHKEILF